MQDIISGQGCRIFSTERVELIETGYGPLPGPTPQIPTHHTFAPRHLIPRVPPPVDLNHPPLSASFYPPLVDQDLPCSPLPRGT